MNHPLEIDEQFTVNQYITFKLGDVTYGLPVHSVQEIIRMPQIIQVPLSPSYVEGIANLRGTVLHIVSGRKIFHLPEQEANAQTRVIVLVEGNQTLGYIVDRIVGVETIAADEIAGYEATAERWIAGVYRHQGGQALTLLLDPRRLLAHANSFGHERQTSRSGKTEDSHNGKTQEKVVREQEIRQFVRFQVGREEYGIDIADVQEILRLPEEIDQVPGAPEYVLGLGVLRQQVLPVINLARLLGLRLSAMDNRSRVIYINQVWHGKSVAVGLAVDSVSEVLRIARDDVRDLPEVLKSRRTQAIVGVCQPENRGRLMYLLDAQTLIPWEALEGMLTEQGEKADADRNPDSEGSASGEAGSEEGLYLIFRLATEEFALPVSKVREILRLPELTSIPQVPDYVAGVANIRGKLVTVFDLRQKLGLPVRDGKTRGRLIIAEDHAGLLGLIVDSIREARKIKVSEIEPVGSEASEAVDTSYLRGIVKLEGNRMVLLLNLEGQGGTV